MFLVIDLQEKWLTQISFQFKALQKISRNIYISFFSTQVKELSLMTLRQAANTPFSKTES